MKINFKSYLWLLFAGVIGFSACKKDEETAPVKVLPTYYTAKLIGAQSNDSGSFFSPKTGKVYFTRDSATFVANQVDFSFAQTGDPTSPKFISLSQRGQEGLTKVISISRLTKFATSTLTKAQFDTISNAYVQNMVLGTSPTVVIEQGKVYEFANAENKSGLIYVSNYDQGTLDNNGKYTKGSVIIDVKFEK